MSSSCAANGLVILVDVLKVESQVVRYLLHNFELFLMKVGKTFLHKAKCSMLLQAGAKVAGIVWGSGGKFMIFNNCNFTRNCELQICTCFSCAYENAKTKLALLKTKYQIFTHFWVILSPISGQSWSTNQGTDRDANHSGQQMSGGHQIQVHHRKSHEKVQNGQKSW